MRYVGDTASTRMLSEHIPPDTPRDGKSSLCAARRRSLAMTTVFTFKPFPQQLLNAHHAEITHAQRRFGDCTMHKSTHIQYGLSRNLRRSRSRIFAFSHQKTEASGSWQITCSRGNPDKRHGMKYKTPMFERYVMSHGTSAHRYHVTPKNVKFLALVRSSEPDKWKLLNHFITALNRPICISIPCYAQTFFYSLGTPTFQMSTLEA